MIDIADSGEVNYVDEYGVTYKTTWTSSDLSGTRLLDFTTVITTPYVWGRPISGKIVNRQVIRNGMCDIIRRVIAEREDGYEIIAEGTLSQECEVPLVFRRESTPSAFLHDLNNEVTSGTQAVVSVGPHFSDPEDDSDSCVWSAITDLDSLSVSELASLSLDAVLELGGTSETFEFVNVWG